MDKLLFKRILVAGLTALAIIYVVYLLLSANFNVVPTENAEQVTVTDKIYSNGYIIRDETYVKNTSGGVVSYNVDDGDEVKKGGSVASVFSSEEDAVARTKAASLEDSMMALTKLEQTRRSNTEGIETVNNDITTNIETFLYNINNANIGKLDSNINSIINSVNHYQSFTGKTSSFKPEIASLQSQINELKKSSGDSIADINAPKAGYFVANCDGYENCFDYSKIGNLTLDNLKNMKKSSVPDNTIGKVISSLNWYIACEITADEATDLTLWDDDVTVDFSDASSNTVPASIYKIVQYNNSDKALVILQCTYMDTTLSEIRQEPVEIGMGTYSGLRVSKKAIHDDYVEKSTYDDKGNEHKESKKVQGVYVLYGSEVQFKEISIVYAGNDFVLCNSSPTDGTLFSGETISLYDQIITEGDDLYDGKVIK